MTDTLLEVLSGGISESKQMHSVAAPAFLPPFSLQASGSSLSPAPRLWSTESPLRGDGEIGEPREMKESEGESNEKDTSGISVK